MPTLEVDDFLEHFGVKGMQWGVRRAQKKSAKAESKWEKKFNNPRAYFQVHNRAADLANTHDVARINNMPRYRNADFTRDSPLRREYYRAHETAMNRRFQQAADEIVGPSPSGRRVLVDERTGAISLSDAQHANLPEFRFKRDNTGHILSIEVVGEPLEHLDTNKGELQMDYIEDVDDFLEHFGVKGMRWGVRRQARLERVQRVAAGTASAGERLRFAFTDTSTLAILRRGGAGGAAAARVSQIERQRDTIQSGQVRVRDALGVYGSRFIVTGRTLWCQGYAMGCS
jgi:hypothetical protein